MKDFSQLTITTDEGEETVDVLLNFYSEEFDKYYVVVCDADAEAADGQITVTPFSYEIDKDENVTQVLEIETREEFELIKERFEESLSHHHDGGCCGGHDGCSCEHGDDEEHHHCCCHGE